MSQEILSCGYLHSKSCNGKNDVRVFDMTETRKLYESTGFLQTPQGKATTMVALRGSTASLLPPDGELTFRHKMSDADILAVTRRAPRGIGIGYHISHVPLADGPREVDVLYFTITRFDGEGVENRHFFLTTKLAQPSWPVSNPEEHNNLKTEAIKKLILRGIKNGGVDRLTTSGAARLVIEENLKVEPWRLMSFVTYYRQSPQHKRQIGQLLHHARAALEDMIVLGIVEKDTKEFYGEPIFNVCNPSEELSPSRYQFDRLCASFLFVYDQLSALILSRQGLSKENAVRVLMKWRSLIMNPTLCCNADIVFQQT